MDKVDPYKIDVVFNKKEFKIHILLERIVNNKIQCDYEIFTNEKISGNEFQKLKAYLMNEGYIEDAFKYYNIKSV